MRNAANAIGWIVCISGWVSISYHVAIYIWPIDVMYAMLGCSGCAMICIDATLDALSGKRFWSL